MSPELFDRITAIVKLSPCRTWRYTWRRRWDYDRPHAMFIGLNPSTADEIKSDPTIRRCIRFARDWGYGGLIMTNLFAFRDRNPEDMKAAPDPVGLENDSWLLHMATITKNTGSIIIAAWGNHGTFKNRAHNILKIFQTTGIPLHFLGITKTGQPKHPLYVKSDTQPQELRYDLV